MQSMTEAEYNSRIPIDESVEKVIWAGVGSLSAMGFVYLGGYMLLFAIPVQLFAIMTAVDAGRANMAEEAEAMEEEERRELFQE